ncbi:MAG TPA: hypothetical protein VFL14_09170 [Xanthomonadales bacterium]|nr:hypothetical protein [Xanthomonadales bacterium]
MNKLLPILLAASALALAACGGDEPTPAPDEATTEAPVAEATPAPVATPEPPPPPPKLATINNEQIGVEPPKNIQDAYNTANKAMDLYCEQEGLERTTFYIKATDQLPDRWRVTFFGAPGGVAMYVYVDVMPDGRYEFQR